MPRNSFPFHGSDVCHCTQLVYRHPVHSGNPLTRHRPRLFSARSAFIFQYSANSNFQTLGISNQYLIKIFFAITRFKKTAPVDMPLVLTHTASTPDQQAPAFLPFTG